MNNDTNEITLIQKPTYQITPSYIIFCYSYMVCDLSEISVCNGMKFDYSERIIVSVHE